MAAKKAAGKKAARKPHRRNGERMLARQLREAIEASGKSWNAIATEAGVAQSNVERFVKGESDLRLSTASRIAEALGYELIKRSAN